MNQQYNPNNPKTDRPSSTSNKSAKKKQNRSAFSNTRRARAQEQQKERQAAQKDIPKTDGRFKVGENTYRISITVKDMFFTYPERFEINLAQLFEDNNLDNLLNKLFMNDSFAVDLIIYYSDKTSDSDYEQLLEDLTLDQLKKFKDVWWAVLMDFFGQPRAGMLKEVKDRLPELMETQIAKSVKAISEDGALSSQERLDSNPGSTQ